MEHIVSCTTCADVYRSLTVIRREAANFDSGAPRPSSAAGFWPALLGGARPSTRRLVYAAAAAALLLAVAIPLTREAWRGEPAPRLAVESTPTSPPAAPLRDHPAFRIDKPPVILSVAVALTPRGAADDRQAFLTALGPALDAYRADDFAEAARRLEALSATYPTAVEPPLYAGISLLLLNRSTDAVPLLERARTLANGELGVEAVWRLSLAYVHAGDPDKARPGFQQLCTTDNAYRTRACGALQALPASR